MIELERLTNCFPGCCQVEPNQPIETDLRERASPACSAAHGRRLGVPRGEEQLADQERAVEGPAIIGPRSELPSSPWSCRWTAARVHGAPNGSARASVSFLILAILSVNFVTGCAPARPFTPGFYSPQNLMRSEEPLPPVAVYLLSDERGTTEPTLILEFASISGHERRDHATEPVSTGVTRAFVEGFRARGFPVIDATARHYSQGESQAKTSVAISGRVLEFGARITRSGIFTYDQRVACRIALDAYDAASRRRLWTKTYSQVTEGGLLPADPITLLSRALERVVEQAATDPELLGILQGRGGLSSAITSRSAMLASLNRPHAADGSWGATAIEKRLRSTAADAER